MVDIFNVESDSRCVRCRGAKLLCGKSRCPVLVKYYRAKKTEALIDTLNLEGSSPPGVFVGRMGYPKVYMGPLLPPFHGDTSLLDTPELWYGKTIEDIVDFRFQLVRCKQRVEVTNVEHSGRAIDITRELAMSSNPTEVEAELTKKPSGRLVLDSEVQPFGPSAPLRKLDVGNLKIDRKIERAYFDTDMKATNAILELYQDGVLVSKLQRMLSVGAFGIGKNRRFVPTRWSITAVDDTISKSLVEEIKDFPTIDEYRVYESWSLDNRFIVLMLPTTWSYELIEAWYPNTVWNPSGKGVVMFSSAEGYRGRSEYADIGGCYYAARLATSEALKKERRQARVVILREAHPGYIMPVGVWNVRENVRQAMKNPPMKFDSLAKAFQYIFTRLDIPMERWIATSKVLRDSLYQKRIEDFHGR
jgi:hypothetical protein